MFGSLDNGETQMEYAFEQPNGHWQHRSVYEFRSEQHARVWAIQCGLIYRGRFPAPDMSNAPGSASWCETQGDNR